MLSQNVFRQSLRAATGPSHDRLDTMMSDLDLTDRDDYVRFLQIQHAARMGVERWIAGHAPAALRPPSLTGAIAADLADLGAAPETGASGFHPGHDADPIGPAWVLAGSSLGNRAMLTHMTKQGAGHPHRFLADEDTARFWRTLTEAMGRERRDPAPAAASAEATFAHFIAIATSYLANAAR